MDADDHGDAVMAEVGLEAEKDAAAEAALRVLQSRRALGATPAIVAHLRTTLEGSALRTEAGGLREWRTPLLTGIADDADRVFATLQMWVDFWRGELAEGMLARVPVHGWWNRDRDAKGLPAGISVDRARKSTAALSGWLLHHEKAIASSQRGLSLVTFQDDVADLVRTMRGRYPTAPRPPREASPRPCPVCGELAVHVEMFGQSFEGAAWRGDFDIAAEYDPVRATPDSRRDPKAPDGRKILTALSGVDVHCDFCGWVGIPKPSTILEWLS